LLRIFLVDALRKCAYNSFINNGVTDMTNEHANEAALDMLEALKRALFILESPVVSPYCTPSTKAQPGTIEAVRAAIAKAEGR
jgi:hypothetical protein